MGRKVDGLLSADVASTSSCGCVTCGLELLYDLLLLSPTVGFIGLAGDWSDARFYEVCSSCSRCEVSCDIACKCEMDAL